MKLKNKKTGEIGNLVLNINPNRESYSVLSTENGDTVCGNLVIADYNSLAELNEEWEDYEEPKSKYLYVIDPTRINFINNVYKEDEPDWCEQALELGIGFETKEEAEQAVEKLKAWKRLKDKGFEFRWIDMQAGQIKYSLFLEKGQKFTRGDEDDLLLLFGDQE